MSALFISHSSADSAAAAELTAWLARQGHRSVFLDFHPERGIPAGRHWEQELYAQLRACQAVVVLCSADSMASPWCFAEITHARALGKPVFPLKIGPGAVSPLLGDLQIVDLTRDREQGHERLAAGLAAAGLDPTGLFEWDGSRAPYPGLLAFQKADAAVYFGREAAIQSTREKLNRLQRLGGARLVLVLGASGSGKSSLMRAGIMPRLQREPDRWLVAEPFRPLSRPFDAVAIALAGVAKGVDWKSIRDVLRRSGDDGAWRDLLNDLRRAAACPEATLLLVIDQFEELLGDGADDECAAFMRLLREMTSVPDAPVLCVAALRSDFLGAFQTTPALDGVSHEALLVPPMAPAELTQVVEGPARVAGVELEPGLASAMVADTATGDALPLLAFALRELWDRHGAGGSLRLEHYRALGGLQGALARAAEALCTEGNLDTSQLELLRQALLRLVRVDPEGRFVRQPRAWAELPQPVQPLLERFVQARLLVSRGELDGARILEVAHEALIHHWQRLRHWVDQDRQFLLWRESLRTAMTDWNRNDQSTDFLLRGVLLSQSIQWTIERPSDLTDAEHVFIRHSMMANRRAVRRKRLRLIAVVASTSAAVLGVAFLLYMQASNRQRTASLQAVTIWADLTDKTANDFLESSHQIALWSLTYSSRLVQQYFVSLLQSTPELHIRFGMHPHEIARALGLRWPTSPEAMEILNAALRGDRKPPDFDQSEALGQGLSELAARLTDPELHHAYEAILSAMDTLQVQDREQAEYQLSVIAKTLGSLAPRLDEDQSRRAVQALLKRIEANTTLWLLADLAAALRVVPGILTDEQARVATASLLKAATLITDEHYAPLLTGAMRSVAVKYGEQQAQDALNEMLVLASRTHNPATLEVVATAAASLPVELTDEQAGQVVDRVLRAIQKTTDPRDLGPLGKGLGALIGKLRGPQLQKAIPSVLKIGQRQDQYSLLVWLPAARSVTPGLTTKQAREVFHTTLRAIQRNTAYGMRGEVSETVAGLTQRLPKEDTHSALGWAMAVIEAPNSWDTLQAAGEVTRMLAGRLTEAETERARESLLRSLLGLNIGTRKRPDPYFSPGAFAALLRAVAALNGPLSPTQTDQFVMTFLETAGRNRAVSGDRDLLSVPVSAFASKLPQKEVSRVFALVSDWMENPPEYARYSLDEFGRALQKVSFLLGERLEGGDATASSARILRVLRLRNGAEYLLPFVDSMTGMASQLPEVSRIEGLTIAKSGLAWARSRYEAESWARAVCALLPRNNAIEFVRGIVESMKYPVGGGSTTAVLMNCLSDRFVAAPRRGAGLSAMLYWIATSYPQVDLYQRPDCPPPARRDVWCPVASSDRK